VYVHVKGNPSVCPSLSQQTFEEAEKGFDETLVKEKGMNRDDRVHGSLLILNELVRISSMEGEVRAAAFTARNIPRVHKSENLHPPPPNVGNIYILGLSALTR